MDTCGSTVAQRLLGHLYVYAMRTAAPPDVARRGGVWGDSSMAIGCLEPTAARFSFFKRATRRIVDSPSFYGAV